MKIKEKIAKLPEKTKIGGIIAVCANSIHGKAREELYTSIREFIQYGFL